MHWAKRRRCALAILACLALACGWTVGVKAQDDDKKNDASESKEGKPLATAKHEKGLVVEVLEIKRDDHDLLYVRWRYRNPTDEAIELLAKSPPIGRGPKSAFWDNLYYFEGKALADTAFRAGIARTEGKKEPYSAKVLPRAAIVIRPNKEYEIWACFYPPQKGVEKITFHVPDADLIEGLSVPKAAKKR